MTRKLVDARQNDQGVNTHVRFEGNTRFTPMEQAVEIVRREGCENGHVVDRRDGHSYLRTNPDASECNNLDHWADD